MTEALRMAQRSAEEGDHTWKKDYEFMEKEVFNDNEE